MGSGKGKQRRAAAFGASAGGTVKGLEQAVTAALPDGMDAYFFSPVLIMHVNGSCYGVLGGANEALVFQEGMDTRYFYLADVDGTRVTIKDQVNYPGHASAIRDILERQDSKKMKK